MRESGIRSRPGTSEGNELFEIAYGLGVLDSAQKEVVEGIV